jgi:excisionase family DNA binding protein
MRPPSKSSEPAVRSLLDLLQARAIDSGLSAADIPSLLCHVAALLAALAAQLSGSPTDTHDDRLLTVDEVAERLALSRHAVYRRAAELPFLIRVGRHLRFSERGLAKYLERRQGH